MFKSVTLVALLWCGIYYDLHIENREEIEMSEELKKCPFCNGYAKLVDHRVDWYVQCKTCKVTVYGDTVNHLDHIEDDDEARAAFDAVDWDELRKSAIDGWNRRV